MENKSVKPRTKSKPAQSRSTPSLPRLQLAPDRWIEAAIDVLLPLGAVSLGLTAIGLVFVIVRAFAA